jgi:hypothetical protein
VIGSLGWLAAGLLGAPAAEADGVLWGNQLRWCHKVGAQHSNIPQHTQSTESAHVTTTTPALSQDVHSARARLPRHRQSGTRGGGGEIRFWIDTVQGQGCQGIDSRGLGGVGGRSDSGYSKAAFQAIFEHYQTTKEKNVLDNLSID